MTAGIVTGSTEQGEASKSFAKAIMSMNSTDQNILRSSKTVVGDEPLRKVPLSTPVNRNRTSGNTTVDSVGGIRSSPPQRTRPVRLMETKRVRTKGAVAAAVGPEKPVSLPDRFRQSLKSPNKPRSNLSAQRPPIGKSRLGPPEPSCSLSSSSSSSSSSNTSSSSSSNSTSPTSGDCGDSGKGSSKSTKPTFRRSGSSPDLFSFQPKNCFCFGTTTSRTSTSTLRREIRPSSTSTSTSHGRSRSVPPSRSWTSTPQRQPALKVWGNIVPSGKIQTGMRRRLDTNLNVLNPGNKNYGVGTVIMPLCRHRDSDVVMRLTYKIDESSLSIYNRERCNGYHRKHDSGDSRSRISFS